MGAGGDILFGEMSQKTFQLLFTRPTGWKPFEAVALSPEPGAITVLPGERKMLALNNFRKSAHCFIGIHAGILKREPTVTY